MKKIIDGKVYSTDTAVKIGSLNRGAAQNNLCETLYRKKTGEYFLHISGGWSGKDGSENICPLIYCDAQRWAEESLAQEIYAAFFGDITNDKHKVILNLNLPADLVERVKRRAAQQGRSISGYVEALLIEATKAAVED